MLKGLIILIVVAYLLHLGLTGNFGIAPTAHGVGWNGNVQVVKTGGGQP